MSTSPLTPRSTQSRAARRVAAFWYALGATAVIGLVWLATLEGRTLSMRQTPQIASSSAAQLDAFWQDTRTRTESLLQSPEARGDTPPLPSSSATGKDDELIADIDARVQRLLPAATSPSSE